MKYYSAKNNAFYDLDINANSMPDDAVEISDDRWAELLNGLSDGSVLGSDENGLPTLSETPKPTKDEYVSIAEREKKSLMQAATDEIAPLQYASDLDMALDDEKDKLINLKKYLVLLNRVDTSTAPDIKWPEKP